MKKNGKWNNFAQPKQLTVIGVSHCLNVSYSSILGQKTVQCADMCGFIQTSKSTQKIKQEQNGIKLTSKPNATLIRKSSWHQVMMFFNYGFTNLSINGKKIHIRHQRRHTVLHIKTIKLIALHKCQYFKRPNTHTICSGHGKGGGFRLVDSFFVVHEQ